MRMMESNMKFLPKWAVRGDCLTAPDCAVFTRKTASQRYLIDSV